MLKQPPATERVQRQPGRVLWGPSRSVLFSPLSSAPSFGGWHQREISAPWALGEWNILLRLEQLNSARLDDETRKALLGEQLETFLNDRVDRILKGILLSP